MPYNSRQPSCGDGRETEGHRGGEAVAGPSEREIGAIKNQGWRSMFELYPSTVRQGKFCLNLLIRATLVALTWAGLLLSGLVFNWLISYVLGAVDAPDSAKRVSSAILLVFILALMGASAATSLFDIFALAKTALRDPSESGPTENS